MLYMRDSRHFYFTFFTFNSMEWHGWPFASKKKTKWYVQSKHTVWTELYLTMQCAWLDLPFAISEPGGSIKGLFIIMWHYQGIMHGVLSAGLSFFCLSQWLHPPHTHGKRKQVLLQRVAHLSGEVSLCIDCIDINANSIQRLISCNYIEYM